MSIHNAMHHIVISFAVELFLLSLLLKCLRNLLRRCSLKDRVLELKPNFKSQFCFFFFFYHYLTSEILFPYL